MVPIPAQAQPCRVTLDKLLSLGGPQLPHSGCTLWTPHPARKYVQDQELLTFGGQRPFLRLWRVMEAELHGKGSSARQVDLGSISPFSCVNVGLLLKLSEPQLLSKMGIIVPTS